MVKDFSELEIGKNFDEIIVEVTEAREPKEYTGKDNQKRTVQNLTVKDSAGSTLILTLWGAACGEFVAQDIVKIKNGYYKDYEGMKQISLGTFGFITRVSAPAKVKKVKKK